MVTRSPCAIGTPRISVSCVARRAKYETGDDHRSTSSTARAMAPGFLRSRSSCSGWSRSATSPCDTALRVVSLPAIASNMKKRSSSISLSAVRVAVVGLDLNRRQNRPDIVLGIAPLLLP